MIRWFLMCVSLGVAITTIAILGEGEALSYVGIALTCLLLMAVALLNVGAYPYPVRRFPR
jgi:hypothetical protein